MKIAYIANIKIPTEKAHGLQVTKMCESFAQQGVEVELIAPRRFNSIKKDIFDYYGLQRNFRIKKLPCLDLIPLDKYIGHLGIWIQACTFNFSLFFYLLFRKPDIIYTNEWSILPFVLLTKNIIIEAHKFPKKYFLHSFYLKKTRKIITITKKLKDLFMEKGLPEEKILTLPVAVDLDVFSLDLTVMRAREELNLPQDKKIIGYTGRFKTMGMEKGINVILQALAHLQKNIIFLAVGGNQSNIDYYKKQAEKMALQGRIIFKGRVHQKVLAKYQKACDVLVMPFPYNKHYAFYMSPAKMFEYMAGKRPIVASNLPSIREVLNNKNAILVRPESAKELCRGINTLLENKKMAEEISARAFEDVKEYTWKKRARKILEFI